MNLIDENAHVRKRDFGHRQILHHAQPKPVGFQPQAVVQRVIPFLDVAQLFKRQDDHMGGTLRNAAACG